VALDVSSSCSSKACGCARDESVEEASRVCGWGIRRKVRMSVKATVRREAEWWSGGVAGGLVHRELDDRRNRIGVKVSSVGGKLVRGWILRFFFVGCAASG
jgi:hypothetical protein